jgi:hypothetical protein
MFYRNCEGHKTLWGQEEYRGDERRLVRDEAQFCTASPPWDFCTLADIRVANAVVEGYPHSPSMKGDPWNTYPNGGALVAPGATRLRALSSNGHGAGRQRALYGPRYVD